MKRAGAAVGVFAVSCLFLFGAKPDGDALELGGYGHAVLDGRLPYRDFPLEYPPGSIPFFTLPAVGHFLTWFRLENALGWAIVVVLVALLTSRVWPPFAVALVPALIGSFTLMRFDVRLTEDAHADIDGLYLYIASTDAPDRAEHVVSRIHEVIESLSTSPGRGTGTSPVEVAAAPPASPT